MTIISKSCFRQNTRLMKLLISCSLTWWIQELSRTCGPQFTIQRLSSTSPVFKYFQGLEFRIKKFKDFQGGVGTLWTVYMKAESTQRVQTSTKAQRAPTSKEFKPPLRLTGQAPTSKEFKPPLRLTRHLLAKSSNLH